ncbi:MAG: choline-responsive transcriptional repressor BetI [Geminicoccaceae bacterium]
MPKLGMEPLRKRQLIEATVASLHAHGFAETTVQTIGRAAGMSPGIIHHYFGGKSALLEETMRALLIELRACTIAALRDAPTPLARLEAVIDASFADRQFQPQVIATWLAFWAEARHQPGLARLQHVYARRLASHLRHGLRPLLAADRVAVAAAGLAAIIDGLWLSLALGHHALTPAGARLLARDHLHRQLG